MGNWYNNVIEAKNITGLNIYTNGCIDFNKIIPEPETEAECPDKYNLNKTPDETVMPSNSKPWFNRYEWQQDNWGTSVVQTLDTIPSIKKNSYCFSTKGGSPLHVIAKLSTMVDGEVILKYRDIDNCIGSPVIKSVWKDGKMIQAFVSTFDYDTEEYNPFEEIETTNQYDI